jgi:transcriptional regulator with XRE-family HTH domain
VSATITNDAFAARIGVSHSMASRIRNGRRLPSVRTLDAIHRELNIPLDELHRAHLAGPEEFSAVVRRALGTDGE